MKKIVIPLSIILIVALSSGLFWITQRGSEDRISLSPTAKNGNKDIVQYVIDMDNFSFSPNIMKTQAGTDFKIKITNKSGIHNFKINKLNFDSGDMYPGDSKIVTIKIPSDAKGNYEFYCAVGNHKQAGMTGILQIGNI